MRLGMLSCDQLSCCWFVCVLELGCGGGGDEVELSFTWTQRG
jgi:hypothetical protein